MRQVSRKVTPRVKEGRVQRKNHRDRAHYVPGAYTVRTETLEGPFRHVLNEAQVRAFVALVPGWEQLSAGLDEIVLSAPIDGADALYDTGSIYLGAWPEEEWIDLCWLYLRDHAEVFEQLGVKVRPPEWRDEGEIREGPLYLMEDYGLSDLRELGPTVLGGFSVDANGHEMLTHEFHTLDRGLQVYVRMFPTRFTERQARAFQLLHLLLHELGHHKDRMNMPQKGVISRGEDYAEFHAFRTARQILSAYEGLFGRISA